MSKPLDKQIMGVILAYSRGVDLPGGLPVTLETKYRDALLLKDGEEFVP